MNPELRPTSAAPRRIAALDGLRAISILFVLYAHWGESPFAFPLLNRLPHRQFDYFGSLGVSIFFIISGFLITTLLIDEKALSGTIHLKNFYLRRVFRIFPAYYAYLAVIALLSLLGLVVVGPMDLLTTALYVRDYVAHTTPWTNHPWSLAVEEQFYLLWPLLAIVLRRRDLVRLCVVVIIASPIVRVATYMWHPASRDLISVMFHTRADTIVIGCLLALVRFDPAAIALRQRLERVHAPAIAIAVLLVASPLLFSKAHFTYLLTVGYTIDNACIAFVLWWAIEQTTSPAARFLNWRPLMVIGTLSYSLYLWHPLFIEPLGGRVVPFPLNIGLTFLTAWLSFELIEKPFNGLRRRFGSVSVSTEPLPPDLPLTTEKPIQAAPIEIRRD